MPASTSAIMKNIERLTEQALIDLWHQEATGDRAPGQAWTAFIEAADKLKLADRIPGSVGRSFRAEYARAINDSGAEAKTADPHGAAPGPKAPRARKAASGPAPASAGSKAGGSGRSRSKAAKAAEREATK